MKPNDPQADPKNLYAWTNDKAPPELKPGQKPPELVEDPVHQLEQERLHLRRLANQKTSPEERESTKSAAKAFAESQGFRELTVTRPVMKRVQVRVNNRGDNMVTPPSPFSPENVPQKSDQTFPDNQTQSQPYSMANIIACNADGSAKPPSEQPQQPKQEPLRMIPFTDGTFIKYVDRPVPKGVVSTQKLLFNSERQTVAIVGSAECAEFLCHCVNTFCLAAHKVQQDKLRAKESLEQDLDAFSQTLPNEQETPSPETL